MKNKGKVIIIILVLTMISLIFMITVIKIANPTKKMVILKSNEHSIIAMEVNDKGLYDIELPNEINMNLKKGQEILIYFRYGMIIEQSSPAGIRSRDIKKIKILKENTNMKIPENVLKRVYNTSNNILISIDEISTTTLTLTLQDINMYRDEYQYSNNYYIRVKK